MHHQLNLPSPHHRPNNLTLVRIYDNRVLDMLEIGIRDSKSMQDFKVSCSLSYQFPSRQPTSLQTQKSTPGHKPLMHFASPLFDTHPRFMQLKQHLIALFNGEAIDSISLAGIEHVISVQLSPLPNPTQPLPGQMADDPALLPTVHLRTYILSLKSSSTRVPYIELVPMGPSLDLRLRRYTEPDPVLLASSFKRPKMTKRDVEKGLGDKKKMRNREVDQMGDLRGRIHLGKQDLSGLKRKGVKALKRGWEEVADEPRDIEMDSGSVADEPRDIEMDGGGGGESGVEVSHSAKDTPRKKRRKD